MSKWDTFPINLQNGLAFYGHENEERHEKETTHKDNDSDYLHNDLEFSTNLILKEESDIITITPQTTILQNSIFISLNQISSKPNSKPNLSPNEHKSTSKLQEISNTSENSYLTNAFFLTNTLNREQTQTQEKDNNNNNNNNNSNPESPNKYKKPKKDLENSFNTLTLNLSEDEEFMGKISLNGSSRSNLALDLLASKYDSEENEKKCSDLEDFINESSEGGKRKKKVIKMQKPIVYTDPNSNRVKKVDLFVLPQKVNQSLFKNKSSSNFCPIHDIKYEELLQKVSLSEFKKMAREGPKIPKSWPDKLKAFPSATTYNAYAKNRYRDVLANEISRVRLKGVEQDYINANFIKPIDVFGRKIRNAKKYIACQAPLPTTLNDFWLMIWQQKSCVIVMLTKFTEKGVKKANSYWPKKKDETSSYADFKVTNKGSVLLENLTITFLELNRSNNSFRFIYHLHYTEWPDFGVPDSTLILRSLITFTDLYSYLGETRELKGPIICHCSAGIGRTGTFIATHLSLTLWKAEEEKPNVYEIVKKLRELRSGMVQSDSQYLFIYKVLNDFIYLTNHPKKPFRYSSVNSVYLIPEELKSKKIRKKAFLKKSNSLPNLNLYQK